MTIKPDPSDVERIDRVHVTGSYFRQSDYDTPVRVEVNESGGRFNHPRSRPTQYFSKSIPGVWREVLRRDDVRVEKDAAEYETQIFEVAIDCQNIADLQTFDHIVAANLDPTLMVADDHAYCRDLADLILDAGFRGVLAPSAASQSHGDLTLALFGEYVDVEWETTTVLANALRGQAVMRRASPPEHLASSVRYRGDTHRPLGAFLTG